MDSNGYMICILQVETNSRGWQKTLTKVLSSIKGVSFTIDAQSGIAMVSGKIDINKILLKLTKAGKHAKLLSLHSGNHFPNTSAAQANYNNNSNSNLYGISGPMMHNYGYGYNYYGHSYPPYMESPYYDQHYYSYGEPPAHYFPQAPVPDENPRLESLCNMM